MNIAHLSTVHARNDTRIFQKMCCSLAQAGHSVTLYVADGLGHGQVRGVTIVDIGKPPHRFNRAAVAGLKMWSAAIRSNHDILHFHDPELIPGGVLCQWLGKPVIYDIHEYYSLHLRRTSSLPKALTNLLAWIYSLVERSASACLSACVVVSPHMLRVLPLQRGIVVENAVRVEEWQPGHVAQAERPARVCYVGVLAEDRRVTSMVAAVSRTRATLALAGRWYPEPLRHHVAACPGWNQVEEWGLVERDDVQRILEQSRAGLLILNLAGDERHASSNKLFEYMAAGLPVIATDLPFTRAVIERHGCGLLVPEAAGSEVIADAISWILDHPDAADRMGRAGRQAVEEHYGWDQAFGRLLALYHDVERGRRGRPER